MVHLKHKDFHFYWIVQIDLIEGYLCLLPDVNVTVMEIFFVLNFFEFFIDFFSLTICKRQIVMECSSDDSKTPSIS